MIYFIFLFFSPVLGTSVSVDFSKLIFENGYPHGYLRKFLKKEK